MDTVNYLDGLLQNEGGRPQPPHGLQATFPSHCMSGSHLPLFGVCFPGFSQENANPQGYGSWIRSSASCTTGSCLGSAPQIQGCTLKGIKAWISTIIIKHNFQYRAEPQDVKIPVLPTLAFPAKQCICVSPVLFSLDSWGSTLTGILANSPRMEPGTETKPRCCCSQQASAARPTLSPAVVSSHPLLLPSVGHGSRAEPCLGGTTLTRCFLHSSSKAAEHCWRCPGSPKASSQSQASGPQWCSGTPVTEQMQRPPWEPRLRLSGVGAKHPAWDGKQEL